MMAKKITENLAGQWSAFSPELIDQEFDFEDSDETSSIEQELDDMLSNHTSNFIQEIVDAVSKGASNVRKMLAAVGSNDTSDIQNLDDGVSNDTSDIQKLDDAISNNTSNVKPEFVDVFVVSNDTFVQQTLHHTEHSENSNNEDYVITVNKFDDIDQEDVKDTKEMQLESCVQHAEEKTTSDLKAHLAVFESKHPIQKGYIARRLLEGASIPSVLRELKHIFQKADLEKHLTVNESGLSALIKQYKKWLQSKLKKSCLTETWSLLVPHFIEPFTIPLQPLPLSDVPLQHTLNPLSLACPEQVSTSASLPSLSRPGASETTTLLQSSLSLEHQEKTSAPSLQPLPSPGTSQMTLSQQAPNCTADTKPSLSEPLSLASPVKPKGCSGCIWKQRTNTNMVTMNKHLRCAIRQLKEREINDKKKLLLENLNQEILAKTQEIEMWKQKYAALKDESEDLQTVMTMLQKSQSRVENLRDQVGEALKGKKVLSKQVQKLQEKLLQTQRNYSDLKRKHDYLKNKTMPAKKE